MTEFRIIASLLRAGHTLLRPVHSATRYDLVIDEGAGRHVRVQCKTGVLRSGAVVFRVCSVSGHRTTSTSYDGEVDAFAVFREATGDVYVVPTDVIAKRKHRVHLRVAPSKNGQARGIHDAARYWIGR